MKKLLCIIAAAALLLLNSCSEKKQVQLLDNEILETAPSAAAIETKAENIREYIVNRRSGKIHYPSCHSVDLMAEHNKKFVEADIQELLQQGYSPCENCNPY